MPGRAEYQKAWAAENKDKLRANQKRWRARNPGLAALRTTEARLRRYGRPVNKCPKIRTLYAMAELLRNAGRDVVIDHIIPLNPRDPDAPVGLHVFENLQLLTAADNLAKADKV